MVASDSVLFTSYVQGTMEDIHGDIVRIERFEGTRDDDFQL